MLAHDDKDDNALCDYFLACMVFLRAGLITQGPSRIGVYTHNHFTLYEEREDQI